MCCIIICMTYVLWHTLRMWGNWSAEIKFDQRTLFPNVCILWGLKAESSSPSQQIYSMRSCVEVRGGWLRGRAVQPSATIMSWVNRTHYALSGTTCRDLAKSFSGGCIQGILKHRCPPPYTLRRVIRDQCQAISGAILSISFWKPRWMHTDASCLKLVFVQ